MRTRLAYAAPGQAATGLPSGINLTACSLGISKYTSTQLTGGEREVMFE